MKPVIKSYKNDSEYSYTSGAYATFELLQNRPETAETVYIHPKFVDSAGVEGLSRANGIEVVRGEEYFRRINQKENTYVAAVFRKYAGTLSSDMPHVVLLNPADMGNLGGAMRTLAAVNITNLAVIVPAADIWHPKTVRASMGAVFRMQTELFRSYSEYAERFSEHAVFPFTPDGETRLTLSNCPVCERYSLLFGCEASGLPPELRTSPNSVRLAQSLLVDSMNLSVAVGVGAYLFANANGQL